MMILRLPAQWAFFFHTKIVFQVVGESQTPLKLTMSWEGISARSR